MKEGPIESAVGFYDVFLNQDDTRLIVISGLNPNDQIQTMPLQDFFINHFDFFYTFYLLLLVSSLIYVFSIYIGLPLMRRFNFKLF